MKNNTTCIKYRRVPETRSTKIRTIQVCLPKKKIMDAADAHAIDRQKARVIHNNTPGCTRVHEELIEPQFKMNSISHDYNQYSDYESFRSTSLGAAKIAVAKRNKNAIISAIFTDNIGQEHNITPIINASVK